MFLSVPLACYSSLEVAVIVIIVQITTCQIYLGEFGVVYKAHLVKWHGYGDPQMVAVKTLKGTQY